MNKTSKMGTLFQEKMLRRETVDYQEECFFKKNKC